VTLIQTNNISGVKYYSDLDNFSVKQLQPFNNEAISFLNDVSKSIIKDKNSRIFPDLFTFGYWCRKSNLLQLRNQYPEISQRKGLGLAFHVAPSNVPVNFAFSFAFSLLSGNSNLVRVPSDSFEQVEILINHFNRVMKTQKYSDIRKSNQFISYNSSNDDISSYFSSIADCRILWGGDKSVSKLKSFQSKLKSVDVLFTDRFSVSIINPSSLDLDNDSELKRFIKNFYNDIFLMDQNACSSPKVIFWLGSKEKIKKKRRKILSELVKFASGNYPIQSSQVVDKFTTACVNFANDLTKGKIETNDGSLYITELVRGTDISKLSGNSGFLYEHYLERLGDIKYFSNHKLQTITYFGIPSEEIHKFIESNNFNGIDRFAPLGKALDIGLIWDGYDLPRTLSRIIEII